MQLPPLGDAFDGQEPVGGGGGPTIWHLPFFNVVLGGHTHVFELVL